MSDNIATADSSAQPTPAQNIVQNWKQEIVFVPARYGIEPVGQGRRFYHIRRSDLSHADKVGGFTETWLRNSLITVGETEDGEVTLTMPFSYFCRKGLFGLMSEDGAGKFFERDARQDVRHHEDDDAPRFGLDAGTLTNANLAAAQAGDFLPDDPDSDFDDDDFVDDDDDDFDSVIDDADADDDDADDGVLGSVLD